MNMMFPKDFIWGVACASYQCEGAWNEDGKGRSIWDDFTHTPGHIFNGDTGDVACDCYHRWAEDVALMKQCNVQAYRFSISWPRIIPDGDGEINPKGFTYYDNLVNALLENGIRPMITLYHWDLPSALQDKGGWMNRDIVAAFGRYARAVAEHFAGRVDTYMTVNEPQCVTALGYVTGIHAPGWRLGEREALKCYFNLCLAHSEAFRVIHAVIPGARVGVATCGRVCFPAVDTPAAREAAYRATFDPTDWLDSMNIFLDPLFFRSYAQGSPEVVERFAAEMPKADWDSMEAPDFVGVNIYTGTPIREDGSPAPTPAGFPMTAKKWTVTPEALRFGPTYLYQRYGRPVMITENGLSCNDRIYLDGKVHDIERIDFLTRYLRELSKAYTEDGVELLGYLQWSFLDNFEWSDGYKERFGIVYVDYATEKRTLKDSAGWYAQVIASNGENLK